MNNIEPFELGCALSLMAGVFGAINWYIANVAARPWENNGLTAKWWAVFLGLYLIEGCVAVLLIINA